jgi:hypothetical protein
MSVSIIRADIMFLVNSYSLFCLLQHVYIPIIFSSGVDYIDAPTPYMMGLHSGVDTSAVTMDGVSCKIKTRFSIY